MIKGVWEMEELRKVEVFRDKEWSEIQFKNLEVNDKFRMFDPDGTPVIGLGGVTEWAVTKGPYRRTEDEVWTVECDDGGGVK
jgi:hypothetical protein